MMARAVGTLLTLTLILNVGWACEKGQADQLSARQGLDDYLYENSYPTNPWVSPNYYNIQQRVPFAGYANPYEGRIPFNRRPSSGYFAKINPYDDNNQESRLAFGTLGANLFNAGLFANLLTPAFTWRPFANLVNRMEACASPSGDSGHCSTVSACSSLSGRPSGSCTQGRVCCINVVTTCGGTVTMNNTYWQSPTTPVTAPSTCALTVKLDSKLAEQATNPICQIRLDFVSFTTAQPTLGTCSDTFQVGGSSTVAPTICGENAGQHMYLDVPSSAITSTDVQLIFNFATGATTRSWNIKIAMLPCGASYLAPSECLQYFTSATGKVKSFNWQDAATAQQLNNQNYKICFRTELVSGSSATQMCVSTCTTTTPFVGFFLTGTGTAAAPAQGMTPAVPAAAAPAATGTAADKCSYDFLAIPGGQSQVTPFTFNDRYCGGLLGIDGATTSSTICTNTRPFRMTFGTDGTEGVITGGTITQPVASTAADTANTGFCINYQEK